MRRMGVDPTEPGFVRIDALRTYGDGGTIIDLPWPRLSSLPSFGVVRTRFDFDNLLVGRAVKAGAAFRPGVEAQVPILRDGWVGGARIGTKGEAQQVCARYVVAASGACRRFA